jgi:membrane protease subunit (stomatin/prohibitin family)
MAGFAEAEIMRAKGYDGKDVLTAEVQKAYAEGLGNMTVSGGGVAGDMIGLGVGMAAAGAVAPQMSEVFKGFSPSAPTQAEAPASASKCTKCGANLPQNAKFCLECGEKVTPPVPEGMIVCPECGNTVPKGKFCPECGHKFIAACPKCGAEVASGAKFCLECGEKL